MSRQVLAVVAAATCAVACAADGALALFQQRAEKITEKKRMGLPGADSVLEKPQGVLKLVNSRVVELQKQLELIQGRNKEAVLRLRDEYKQRLFRQRAENTQVDTVNQRIAQEIDTIKTHNQNHRQHADSLSLRSQSQLADARAMRENVTSADEFIKSALAIQKDSLQAPELRVLAELRENESSKQQGQLHASAAAPSLLQIGKMATVPTEAAQALVRSLAASFDQIAQEQNESTASLQTQFEGQLKELTSRHSALLEEQERLNKTRDDVRSLSQRIVVADEQLTNLTASFEEQTIALHGYLEGTWETGAPEGLEAPDLGLLARPSSLEQLPKKSDGKVVIQVGRKHPGKHPGKRQATKKV